MNTEGRLDRALALLEERHRTDPAHPNSLEYHRSLAHFTELLSPLPPTEALVLAANAQHVQRWDRPRHDYSEGLTGYKMWRVSFSALSFADITPRDVYDLWLGLTTTPLCYHADTCAVALPSYLLLDCSLLCSAPRRPDPGIVLVPLRPL